MGRNSGGQNESDDRRRDESHRHRDGRPRDSHAADHRDQQSDEAADDRRDDGQDVYDEGKTGLAIRAEPRVTALLGSSQSPKCEQGRDDGKDGRDNDAYRLGELLTCLVHDSPILSTDVS